MNRGSGKSSDETLIEMDRTAWSGGGKCLLHAFTRFHTWECFKTRRKKKKHTVMVSLMLYSEVSYQFCFSFLLFK